MVVAGGDEKATLLMMEDKRWRKGAEAAREVVNK